MTFKVGDLIVLTCNQGMPLGTFGEVTRINTNKENEDAKVEIRYAGQCKGSCFPYQDPLRMRHLTPLDKLI
jgi:hypothetical protein